MVQKQNGQDQKSIPKPAEATQAPRRVDSEELIQFTSIQKDAPTPPRKDQRAKYKVPETELDIEAGNVEITARLEDVKVSDISLAVTRDDLTIKGKNRKVAYYTEIKLPVKIVPQSAVARFKDGTLAFKAMKLDETKPRVERDIEQGLDITGELQETKERLNKFQEQYHTIQLEYQNLLVKGGKETESKVDAYKISVIERILKSIDNFELALVSASNNKNKDIEQVVVGINMILKELKSMITEEGVQEIPSLGMLLDPTVHEVTDCMETDKHPENTILEEFQKGYKYKDRIIRPSKVKVAVSPKKIKKEMNEEKKI